MRALFIAWGSTAGVLLILLSWLGLSYDPNQYTSYPTASQDDSLERDSSPEQDNSPERNNSLEADGPDTVPNREIEAETPDITTTTEPEVEVEPDPFELDDNITRPDFGSAQPDEAEDSVSDIVAEENTTATLAFINPANSALEEEGPYGAIPVVNEQQQPWQYYARPFERPGDRPRISIIVVGMGLSGRATKNSIDMLPPDISLAFSPYGQDISRWSEEARQNGHETLLMVPMEPLDFPVNDPGPHTLMNTLPADNNIDRLHYVLSRMKGYVGVVNDMGSKFTADPDAIAPIMQDLQRRGLLFVDARTTRLTVAATSAREFGVPRAQNDRYIDNDISAAQIDRYLRELENIALRSGNAVGIARAYPITIERLVLWAQDLRSRGIELAPITAIGNRQTVR